MDPSARFFGKLRNLAVNLETETASLQQTHQNNIDEEDPNIEGGVRVLHELNSEVRALKGQVKEAAACQQAVEKDVRSFITNCMVLKQRTTEDIQRLRRHFEKYGYNAPTNTQKHPALDPTREDLISTYLDMHLSMPKTSPSACCTWTMATTTFTHPRLVDFGLRTLNASLPMTSPWTCSAGPTRCNIAIICLCLMCCFVSITSTQIQHLHWLTGHVFESYLDSLTVLYAHECCWVMARGLLARHPCPLPPLQKSTTHHLAMESPEKFHFPPRV
ncbi:hypothetical protein DPEC_G00363280 [Dallia pectoralis]|nr:hypothetical protein DPEC_G00363280 [Dallia pectoralis]